MTYVYLTTFVKKSYSTRFLRKHQKLSQARLSLGSEWFEFPLYSLKGKERLFGRDIPETQNICITFVQRRPKVFDVGPALYKYNANVVYLLWFMASHACKHVNSACADFDQQLF